MTSVIGTPFARAPRNVRSKNPQILLKNKDLIQGTNGIFQNISEVVQFMENFELVQSNSSDLRHTVLTLCANLKSFGPQLEINYKDQLDRVFIHLRNAGRDDSLDKVSRLHLLEVVELRAGRWTAQEQVNSYYQSKLNELQASGSIDNVGQNAGQNEPSPPASPSPLLLPGEVVKSSGKYNITNSGSVPPTKNSIKDEVVIRNADSGKVNPGASERLVQITGAAPDNIERARQLIEQTIQRNASPVPQMESAISSQSTSINQDLPSGNESRKLSLTDSVFEDYQYSVVVGEQCIKITGQSLELVQIAKLVLDEYFASLADKRPRNYSICSSMDDGVVMFCPSQESPRDCAPPGKKILKYDRKMLLLVSKLSLCLMPPANFDLVRHNAPDIVRKEPMRSESFFNAEAYLEKNPERLNVSEDIVRHYDISDDF